MKIKPKIESRTLTNINKDLLTKIVGEYNIRSLKARHRIMLYLYDEGKKYYIDTTFHTSNTRMCGCNFHDTEFDIVQNAKLTQALKELFEKCNTFIDEHYDWPIGKIKDAIRAIIKGDGGDAERIAEDKRKHDIVRYIDKVIIPSKNNPGTKKVYRIQRDRLMKYSAYLNIPNIYIEDIDSKWLKEYYYYLTESKSNFSSATIHQNFRNIKHILNTAYEEEIISRMPFGHTHAKFNMPKQKNVRHFVMTAQQFADFRDYPCTEKQQRHKDIALLSFYLGGMNMSDLCKQRTINDGRWEFDRQKTGIHGDIPICEEAMEIIKRYKGDKYVLNIAEKLSNPTSATEMANKNLKKIGYIYKTKDRVGKLRKENSIPLYPDISMYTFRRTFATIAAELGFSNEVIAGCLCQSTQTATSFCVTEIYIVRRRKQIDECFDAVLNEVRKYKGRDKETIDEMLKSRNC